MTDAAPPPPPSPSNNPPPGWYPSTPGSQAYWDGTAWTGDVAPLASASVSDEKTWAVLTHLSVFLLSFVGPLVVYLIKRDESPFLRAHAAAALNLQITLFIAAIVSVILILVIIGIFMILAVIVIGIVYPIVGAVAAGRGDYPNLPGVISFVS
ncbi:MAG: DUF4870 domain-containing protein [Acidimicrobiales bacterium]|nr:DUF4870 domain-containing protein [Acidimicrobiales bacterium]